MPTHNSKEPEKHPINSGDPNNPLHQMIMEPSWFVLENGVTFYDIRFVHTNPYIRQHMEQLENIYRIFRPIRVRDTDDSIEATELGGLGKNQRNQVIPLPKNKVLLFGLLDDSGIEYYTNAVMEFDNQRDGVYPDSEYEDDDEEDTTYDPFVDYKGSIEWPESKEVQPAKVQGPWDKTSGPFGDRWDFLKGNN